jgi:hypothetical protein
MSPTRSIVEIAMEILDGTRGAIEFTSSRVRAG